MKLLEVFGVMFLFLVVCLPFVGLVAAGEIDFTLVSPDANVVVHNESIPTNWQFFGEKQVVAGSTHFVSPLGQLTDSLDSGAIYQVIHDGNLLLKINSINESSCNLFVDVGGITYELSATETKVLPVTVGQKFGVKFTQTNYGNHCALNFDLNAQWSE